MRVTLNVDVTTRARQCPVHGTAEEFRIDVDARAPRNVEGGQAVASQALPIRHRRHRRNRRGGDAKRRKKDKKYEEEATTTAPIRRNPHAFNHRLATRLTIWISEIHSTSVKITTEEASVNIRNEAKLWQLFRFVIITLNNF
jgi:hypothetical protein